MGHEMVEGEWKDFIFKMATPEDTPRILELIRKYFYPYEVLCSHLCSGETNFNIMALDFSPWVIQALEDKLSFFAEHKETKKLVGVRIITWEKKGGKGVNLFSEKGNNSLPPLTFPPNPIIINFLTKASAEADIFSAYPDIDNYAEFFMTATDPEFRGQGLATEMYSRAIKLFQSMGIPLAKGVLTSPWTRKACSNLKFAVHSTLYLKDYLDEDGNPYFPNASNDEYITCVAKRIEGK